MSSIFTTNIHLEEPALGDYVNSWNTPVNSNFVVIDQAFGGSVTYALSGTERDLTVAQSAYYLIVFTGALTQDINVILPATIGGSRHFFNLCTGAHLVRVFNGITDPSQGLILPQGVITPVVLTGGHSYYDTFGNVPVGGFVPYGGASIPIGFLLCYGQAVSQATYSGLFASIGTTWGPASGGNFTLPDLRGRLLAGADNMGGSAAGRLSGFTLGAAGGEQTHQLTTAELASHLHAISDPGHVHGLTDPGHVHGITDPAHFHAGSGGGLYVTRTGSGVNDFAANGSHTFSTATNTAAATTGISVIVAATGLSVQAHTTGITQTQGAGTNTPHNNVQPTAAVNMLIKT